MGKIKNLRIVTMLKPMNMYKKLIISVLLLEIVIFSAIVLLCKKFIIPKEVESALITQVGVLLTFIGSLASIGLTLDSNIKQKRAENVLNTKLKYYHQFCEAYVKKCSYIKYPMTLEAIESNMEFVKEVNRLPLYSSQKIILLIEKNKDRYINQISNSEVEEIQKLNKEYENLKNDLSNDENIDLKEKIKKIESKIQDKMKNIIGEDKEDNSFGELYRLIREDLNNDSFEQFTGELKSTLTIPNIVPIKTKQ
ncbi:MAG: hypothetical protein ACLRLW_04720 [Terrisporobacter sp.]|uniref:hypothetical protein n=1 Tax=Terrisporobacter sp. TaxID=1965305 RepID=UPI0039A082BF